MAAEQKGKADEKETKASTAADEEIKECAIDGSECQTPDGKCKKTTPKGPFMGDDLVSCADKKPTEQANAGLSWAGIEPPLPPEKCPPATAACKAAKAACGANGSCKAGMGKGAVKGLIHVGCKGTKAALNKFFAWAANCCDPKNIGFSDNIDMFKMQITSMPVYHNMGTTGRFKAYHGAGSVCGMVKSLAAGVAAGDDGGVFVQKPSFKEVAAKHKAANAATAKAHAATAAKANAAHKGLVGKVVSGASTRHAAAHARHNGRVAKSAGNVEKFWAKKEAGFRAKARALNKKQRHAAKSMEKGVKDARKQLAKDTAASMKSMHEAMAQEKKLMAKSAAFQKKMHGIQVAMAKQGAAAKKASAARLAKYKKEMLANAKAISAGKAKQNKIAADMKAANLKLAADQKALNNKYKATMAHLAATNKKNQAAFNAAQKESQNKFSAKFAGNKEAAAKTARINRRHAAEQHAKHKADSAYAKKHEADAKALAKSRAATAERFAKTAEKADKAFEKDNQEANQKQQKANRAAKAEKASKHAAEKKGKADEKSTKASTKPDLAIKECKIDGSECQTPDGKCHKVTDHGPYMADDLVSCSKTKPAEAADAGLSWAGILPPLPPAKCPPPSAKCKAAKKACIADGKCHKAMGMGCFKGSTYVGCHRGKAALNKWFAFGAECCNPKAIGFKDNIPMFKMQITDMPVYKNSGTTGRFKANRGAGSVCTMMKSLVAGASAGFSP